MVKSNQKNSPETHPKNDRDGGYPTRRWIAAMRFQGWPEEYIDNVVDTVAEPRTLLTLAEAAKEFKISVASLKTWIHRGRLVPRGADKFHAPGGRRHLVDREDVAYLKANPPPTGRPRKIAQQV